MKQNVQLQKEILAPYVHAATSDNTRLAFKDFVKKGNTLPATAEVVAAYLQAAGKSSYFTLINNLKISPRLAAWVYT
ncbi:MAG: hypothetical protein AABY34_07000 [Pseudomonadota bacterium]